MKPSKNVVIAENLLGTAYHYTRSEKSFEIWKGFVFVCMLSYDTHRQRWAASHNMTPDKAAFRFHTPLEAISHWEKS